MDLLDVLQTTNACRFFKTDPVPDELVLRVMDAARWAPSGSNSQPVSLIAVRDQGKRQALHDLYQPIWDQVMAKYESGEIRSGFSGKFLGRVDHFARNLAAVPVMIVVCANAGSIRPIDAGLDRVSVVGGSSIYPAVQNMLLAARNEGLGTTLTTLLALAETEIKALLDIPEEVLTAAVVMLGWPEKPFPTSLKRRALAEMAYLDTFGATYPGG